MVKKKGDFVFSSRLFNVRISDNEDKAPRFGFVVSKKISKSSVVRNRTKRTIRGVVEENLGKIANGKNVVFVSKKQLGPEQRKEVKQEMENIFKKAKILK